MVLTIIQEVEIKFRIPVMAQDEIHNGSKKCISSGKTW
jgi:hypothetical protein